MQMTARLKTSIAGACDCFCRCLEAALSSADLVSQGLKCRSEGSLRSERRVPAGLRFVVILSGKCISRQYTSEMGQLRLRREQLCTLRIG